MEVNIKQAQKMFFAKSSFEMIFFEAFANALDAGATEFNIKIDLPKSDQLINLSLELSDNGAGFDDNRFSKFGKLFDVEERTHKGLGRLVYLCYFDTVYVDSVYEGTKHRTFTFDENFQNNCEVDDVDETKNGTTIRMTGFNGQRLGKNEYINPNHIKEALLENFYMKFYKAKLDRKPISVSITLKNSGRTYSSEISDSDLPEFTVVPLNEQLDLYNKIEMYYYIQEVDVNQAKVITALAVDDRTMKVDIIDEENFHSGYEMIFLLMSESFKGEVNESRTGLSMDEPNLNAIKTLFRKAISEVIKEKVPKIEKVNKERIEKLKYTFPHLDGYFDTNEVGYLSQTAVLKKAQDQFFRDQSEILYATNLTEEQFEKSLNLSARALAEYILFRQNVITKMRNLTGENVEADLHNLIAPMKCRFDQENISSDLYRNNVWVLDDKFMSYCTVLSDEEMTKVINVITGREDKDTDDDRPDITLFFSGDPNSEERKIDVVVVELKRLGIKAEQNSIVEFQLDTRTQRLAEYYGMRIQRMWFYGVVDFDERYETHLVNNGFNPLFSNGNVYFRSKTVYTDKSKSFGVIQNAYIMDFKALVEDASSRNETFLKILRHQFEDTNIKNS